MNDIIAPSTVVTLHTLDTHALMRHLSAGLISPLSPLSFPLPCLRKSSALPRPVLLVLNSCRKATLRLITYKVPFSAQVHSAGSRPLHLTPAPHSGTTSPPQQQATHA
jgi:hypothetical protein